MEEVTFARDTTGILIPDGLEIDVVEGSLGWITQVLGGNYTVQLETGRLVRVAAQDADAIGKQSEAGAFLATHEGPVTTETVWEILRTIYDPEIPLDVVELGLIYGVAVEEVEGGIKVDVQMTLTAPGCGMGQVLADDVDYRVRALPGVVQADIELVFDPPWTPDRMSEAGRLELGMFF